MFALSYHLRTPSIISHLTVLNLIAPGANDRDAMVADKEKAFAPKIHAEGQNPIGSEVLDRSVLFAVGLWGLSLSVTR
jgi:hypothetical protein